MKAEASIKLEQTIALEERYQLATYKKMPLVAERGEGVWIFTSDGEKYLDLYGGHSFSGTRHSHQHVGTPIKVQAERPFFFLNLFYLEARARDSEKLV